MATQRKRIRKIEQMLADPSPRLDARFRLLQQFKRYVHAKLERYKELPTFSSLVNSLEEFNAALNEIEAWFIKAHDGDISDGDFERFLVEEYIPDLSDAVSDHHPSYVGREVPDGAEQSAADAEAVMGDEWHELAKLVEQLQDGLQGINPPPLKLDWQA